jgi:hypothetical protein
MMRGTEDLRTGNNQLLINTNKLSAGLYYLKVEGPGIDQQVKIQKL